MRIEILTFDGFDELDVFGPFEALSGPGVDVALVTVDRPREVVTDRGLRVAVDEVLGAPDGVVVPGGGWLTRAAAGAWAEVRRGDVPRALAAQADRGAWIASVCTGAFLLGEAGLLAGRSATTNAHALTELVPIAGRVLAERVVDAGPVVTAGGPSCGLDLALHLIERFRGRDAALAHADALQLDAWAPAVVAT